MNPDPRIAVSRETLDHLPEGVPIAGELVAVDPDAPIRELHDVDVLWRRQRDRTRWLRDCLPLLGGLRWVHTETSGVDRLPLDRLAARGVSLTNVGDAYAPAVAEWVVGALIMAARRLDHTVRSSDAGGWDPGPEPRQLAGGRVVVVGLGAIGRRVAAVCRALELQVVGATRGGAATADAAQRRHVDRVIAATDLAAHVDGALALIICAPLTPRTRGMIDEAVLRALPDDAWVVNAARGELVDEQALVHALDRGELGGAVLDTVTVEPLPSNHPLRVGDNVIISPHVAGRSERAHERALAGFLAELHRYRRGAPFQSPVDLREGY